MKIYLSFIFTLFVLPSAFSQQWTFANNFGGNVAGFSDAVKAICTDAAGNVYATGNFNATINFGNGTASLTATAGGTATDGFVAKFNAAGRCQWAIRFGGAATDQGGLGIVTNGATVYVTGQSQFPATIGSMPLATVGGSTDGVVFALNASNGATLWAKAFGGGSTNDAGQAICLDLAGNVYISGIFSTRTSDPVASFGTAGAFSRTVQGSMAQATSDMFVAQLNPSTGAFNWVSSGGAASQAAPLIIGNDNISGSGITFIPATNQLVVVGSFNAATANYFSNGSSTSSVTLTNKGQADLYILRLDLSGNFLSGLAAGGTTNDEALAVTYDAATDAAYITGYFNSGSIAGALDLTNSSPGFDEIFYARYNPVADTIVWAKNASGATNDAAFATAADGAGQIYVTGRYQGTISFPAAGSPLTAVSAGADDIFLANINPATGNALQLATGNGAAGTDAGLAVAASTNHDVWTGGIIAGGTISFSPSSPSVSATVTVDQEMFIARYNDPPPVINTQPQPVTACAGLPASFSVAATGSPLTYQWQESPDAGFSTFIILTNTGIYSNVTTATLTISDNTTVNGKYYRVIVTSSGGSVTSNGALLTVDAPSLPTSNSNVVQGAGTSGNLYYTGACSLLDKVVPSGASPITGSVNSQVWVEGTVPTFASKPFVQRHYQITPAINPTTATATVTLYFTQAEFDAFNTAPGSTLKLPSGPSDAAGITNLRIGKYAGSTSDGTGLPGSYSSSVTIIDPLDANITWNAAHGYWEVTFDVNGFSGFIVQTSAFPLPVNLVSFSAQSSGAAIQVKWTTSQEINNDHFELERATDGRTFIPIATIPAITGNGARNYGWTDENAASLNNTSIYYRLKIVSISGMVEYSDILIVNMDNTNKLITCAANPFKEALQLNLHMPANGMLAVKISDVSGRILIKENLSVPMGFCTQVLNSTGKLAAGIYIVSVYFEKKWYTFKTIKQY